MKALPLDYMVVCMTLMLTEIWALKRNWTRWARNEYNHQFEHNIGLGNLKEGYSNGDYGFDPLQLAPRTAREYRRMQEKELNNGRLAMVAFVGMFVQEYTTGIPVSRVLLKWLSGDLSGGIPQSPSDSFDLFEFLFNLPGEFFENLNRMSTPAV
eukprot:CAMPEP_0182424772 /NCGR_PEP_ID=MMETSP1167-20130531/11027_1 /TAXON_ID=2988 /ORGANISM="Mallomonas Sp, Strain CCMP3275" /LENGTH=153 /DNA_ID=CAMNT_0024604841 /DNA_START=795 /DNA_END=1256 /DNA_ORIENTATION=-